MLSLRSKKNVLYSINEDFKWQDDIIVRKEGILGGVIATQLRWTPLVAFAFMVFCLLYVPCVAAIGAIRGETNSWKWAGFAVLYTTMVA